MFQGSQNVGKGEHLILVRVNGGDVNGTTSDDSTNYFERVPANQLDMALFLESDRMRALRISPANLDNQRSTVQEERRIISLMAKSAKFWKTWPTTILHINILRSVP